MTAELEAWLAEHEQVLRDLRRRAAADGVDLDETPESLPRLIEWVARRMVRRPEGAPVDTAPPWSRKPKVDMARLWTDDTLWLLAAAGHYYGEVLLSGCPRARWAVGHDPHPAHFFEGDVVVELPNEQVPVVHVVSTFVGSLLAGRRPPDAILAAYHLAVGA